MKSLMKSKLIVTITGCLIIFVAILIPLSGSVAHVYAASNFQLSGKVTDASSNPIGNTTITVTDSQSNTTVGTATTDSNGNYSLLIPQGTYNVTATPPPSSGFQSVTDTNQAINNDTVLNFTLVPVQITYIISGHITDKNGAPLSGITVTFLNPNGPNVVTSTDTTGFYTTQTNIANFSGMELRGAGYNLITDNNPLSFTQNTTLDFQLVTQTVTVHVQDTSQNPVASALVGIQPLNDITISSIRFQDNAGASGKTDASGNTVLQVFANSSEDISVNPPSPYQFIEFTQAITQDTTLTITVQAIVIHTVSGHITDKNGAPLPGITVRFFNPNGPDVVTSTDTTGFYTIQSGVPSFTGMELRGGGFDLITDNNPLSFTQNTTLNFQLVTQTVTVHVQDSSQNPVASALVGIQPLNDITISSIRFQDNAGAGGKTDASGNTVLQVFANSSEDISVNPPSPYQIAEFTQAITQDTTIIVSLQFKNRVPVINAISNATLNEGSTYTATGSFTDPDSTSWTATVDYGDGSGSQPLTLAGTNFSLNHIYKDSGIYTVTVSITDNQGATGTGTAAITVNNVAPTVGTITVATSPVQVNTAITASANFTDPGVLDTHTASWNWGDSNITAGTVTESNGSGSVSNNHTYTAAGVYTITITLTDNDGGVGTATYQYIAVFDPNAGFLTGSGKYSSQAGWEIQNPQATGEVKFGTEAKYTTGNTPQGKCKIDFKAGNLLFNSTSFQWLVVNGTKATLKGSGTVNGSGNYTILLSVIDGSSTGGQSLIRVKITDPSNNVIYDTQPGAADTADPTTPLTNGSIKVH